MGIENLVVNLANQSGSRVYYAGQVISGQVSFVTTKPYKSDGVFVKFMGMAEVQWSEQRTHGIVKVLCLKSLN